MSYFEQMSISSRVKVHLVIVGWPSLTIQTNQLREYEKKIFSSRPLVSGQVHDILFGMKFCSKITMFMNVFCKAGGEGAKGLTFLRCCLKNPYNCQLGMQLQPLIQSNIPTNSNLS